MKTSVWMLELDRARWRLYAGHEDGPVVVAEQEFAEGEPGACAQAIHDALAADGYQDEAIVLALGSDWCLAATLEVSRPQELRDRQTMQYRLEEWIPWGAEDCVCDYSAIGYKVFAIAAPCVPLADFFRGLETQGVSIQSIVPTALLAAAAHLEQGDWPSEHTAAFKDDGSMDCIRFQGGKPTAWSWFPARSTALREELEHIALETGSATNFIAHPLDGTARTELLAGLPVQVIDAPSALITSRSALAVSAAERILQGRIDAPMELKRGPFGRSRGHVALRRHWVVLEAAAAILTVTIAGALIYRGQAAGRQVELFAAEQAAVFRSVFPNTKVPVGIKSRLESELAKLKGLQGDDSALPGGVPATTMLHRLLASLPADRRFRLLEIRIEEGTLYLDGEVRVHGDAEVIAQQLRSQGFAVAPPRTQRLDDKRVSLRITGNLPLATQPAQGKKS